VLDAAVDEDPERLAAFAAPGAPARPVPQAVAG
jgi:hypothetical protein